MDSSDEMTRVLPTPEWDDPQSQMLQDTWLLTLFAVLLATAIPWFVGAINIDFADASWALLVLGAIYAGLALVAGIKPDHARARRHAQVALHLCGILGIGTLWLYSGGLQNPAFLLAFALPVIAASALSRWQPYFTAALGVLVAGAVALIQAPELRWYVAGLHGAPAWLSGLLSGGSAAAAAGGGSSPFPGFYAPLGFDVVLLEGFAVLLFASAVAAETLGNSFERVIEHLRAARIEGSHAQEMWATLVAKLPIPALLVDVETLQIVLASRQLEPFCPPELVVNGQGLFEAIRFSYPERVQELVAGKGGTVGTVIVHTATELRIAQVHVQHVVYDGRLLALVLLQDMTAASCLEAAFDAQEQAALVINAQGRVVVANKHARALFPGAAPGSEATRLIGSSRDAHWWEPGVAGRCRLQLSHLRRVYQATCTAVGLPGEQESLYVVTLTPLTAATGTDPAVSVVR